MSRKQFGLTIAAVMFMMVWGLDLIASVKLNQVISIGRVFSIFNLSQLVYGTLTLLATWWMLRKILRRSNYLCGIL